MALLLRKQIRLNKLASDGGFALPTILIASIVMLTVLLVSVTSTTAVRTAMLNQYYSQLAQVAGEAGVAYAQACLAQNGNVPLWSDTKPLTPATDCSGNSIATPTANVLVVAGGGGGATDIDVGGGGGGGGFLTGSLSLSAQSYSVTVGAGGARGTGSDNTGVGGGTNGTQGGNSIFSSMTAIGGGYGGTRYQPGGSGGSGGGGGDSSQPGGLGTSGQGYNGGTGPGMNTQSGNDSGGGGGAGGAASYNTPGVGLFSSIGNATFAKGGRGAQLISPADGAANTGDGGTGARAGGSGVVIISFSTGALTATATGGTCSPSGGNTVCTFTSTGTFNVTSVGFNYVTSNGNIRSSFKVGMPLLDSNGKAKTVPNTGFLEITRTSNGDVWRRYNQPAVQAAVVPDLCSGTATATLGWNNAVGAGTGVAFPEASAQQIAIAAGAVYTGPAYFRKDFSVTSPATYNVYNQGDDQSDLYIDGQLLSSVVWASGTDTKQIALSTGCHTIVAKLTNKGYNLLANASGLKVAVTRVGSSVPTVVTDTSWRVTAGISRNFSEANYYYDPNSWAASVDLGGATQNGGWTPATGDSVTRSIASVYSRDASGYYPSYAYTLFRDSRIVTVTSPTTVKLAYGCDDNCKIYLDGNLVASGVSTVATTMITLPEGRHQFGLQLYNVTGPSNFIFGVFRSGDNAVLTNSDSTWLGSNIWSASEIAPSAYSYDNTFFPTPDPRTINTLIVAGGGSGGGSTGGGGGAGGVISTLTDVNAGIYSVVVGTGGAAPGNQSPSISGVNSSFNGLIAIGGGGGAASHGSGPSYGASPGGSGGGSQDYYSANVGAPGTALQGNTGGALGNVNAGGGGGAGGGGWGNETVTIGGAGGIGMQSAISGTAKYYGGGGGGGNGGAGGLGGGGNGADVGGAGTANTGGGGGGGWSYATGNGGAGGSGVVIISYPTGSITATGGTITTSGGYTIHTFTSSGTFSVGTPTALVNSLTVAGGGGGGSGALGFNNGGGGGGGGVVYNNGYAIGVQPYSVTVGSGGAANANGANSVFDIITATGGGRGGGLNPSVAGAAGGSGGGGAPSNTTVGGVGSPVGQGYSGATGNSASPFQGGGGGGGGQAGNTNGLGYGGNGIQNSIYGVSLFFAGGGGGGADASAGAGGSGGGGAGVIYTSATGGVAGAANTGGGGGGGASQGGSISGGAGGSGIVIISYPTGSITATGGTITYAGGNTIHTFRSSGTFNVMAIN